MFTSAVALFLVPTALVSTADHARELAAMTVEADGMVVTFAGAFDCENCGYCSWDSEYAEIGSGSLKIDDSEILVQCFYWHLCSEECDPRLASADEGALRELLDGGAEAPTHDWVLEHRERFNLRLVEGVLEVAQRCGRVVAWVPLTSREEHENIRDALGELK